MVAVNSIDAYPFWAFSDLICHLRIQEQVFSGYTVLPDIKENELGSSDQEASPSAGKNTDVVLVPCCAWKCVPTDISGDMDISKYFWSYGYF